jgi:cation transport ATPase
LLIVDNGLDWSFHYRISNKIDELEKVESIIQNPKTDSATMQYAFQLRNSIENHKSVFDYFFSLRSSTTLKKTQTNKPPAIARAIEEESIKGGFIFILSTIIVFIVAISIFAVNAFVEKNESVTFINRLALTIISTGSFGVIAFFFSVELSKIPIINGQAGWNYLINVLAQIAFFVLIWGIVKLVLYFEKSARQKRIDKNRLGSN